jgi:MEMO1 family protein
MKIKVKIILLSYLLLSTSCGQCNSQTDKKRNMEVQDRMPAVAGQFYPSDKNILEDSLKAMFKRAERKKTDKSVLAVISPHAGYIFSGEVAASSFNQIEKKKYKNVFIIGSSHHAYFEGASIYLGDFITPLGKVKVNKILAESLIEKNKCFVNDPGVHLNEHTIEVQLPFLQYVLGNDINLIPVLLGTQSESTCQEIANALKPFFNSENLFIISTDFSHYPSYTDAQASDNSTAGAIELNSAKGFLKTIRKTESSGISNLATAACGWTSVLTMLDITEKLDGISILPIIYKNSGDSKFADKSSVVGYYSLAITENEEKQEKEFLSKSDKKELLHIARFSIEEYLKNRSIPEIDQKKITPALLMPCGAFVTLYKNGELRGCIGNFGNDKPLYKIVQEMAIASSVNDYRFDPVSGSEVKDLSIEISVLTSMQKIKSIDEITLGKHGIYIKKGANSGTFLPKVATETGWSKEEFLGHCAHDKAGLDWDGWKDAEIYIYEAVVFNEKEVK